VIRVVLDPGVFISALIGTRGGAPDLVVRAFIDDHLAVVACPSLIRELEQVLARPEFSRYVDERARREFGERIRRHMTLVDDPEHVPSVTRDPKDDYLLAPAIREGVDAVVSGDGDLLARWTLDRPTLTSATQVGTALGCKLPASPPKGPPELAISERIRAN
jgi:uncharacterized protein